MKQPKRKQSQFRPKVESREQETRLRGLDILNSPQLNKGTSFRLEERHELGLVGLMPQEVTTLEMQTRSAYLQYEALPDALSKNTYLTALHDRNEVLFFKLFSEHLREMIPILNDLTAGKAMVQSRHELRRPRGVYLSIDQPENIEQSFLNLKVGSDDVDLILATDAEQILGIGDWGVAGIEVSIGKLAIYTAAGGIDPSRVIPVMLDVGTNRESLLADPMYIGNRHRRVRGPKYDEFIEEYLRVSGKLFPNALLQLEDFAAGNGRKILDQYRTKLRVFNDDMQGTGAIAQAAVVSALRVCGKPMRRQKVVIFGAGTAGIGVADQLLEAMQRDGLTRKEALQRFWCVDRWGLVRLGQLEPIPDFQLPYARPKAEGSRWKHDSNGDGIGLEEVVRRVQPTILVGASALAGAFTKGIVKEMAAHTERPIFIVLSCPAARSEANATDLIVWTEGRALVATGSSFAPVTHQGVTYSIATASNSLLYPGLGLGVIVAKAKRVSEGMMSAAASAVSSLVTVRQAGSSLLPQLDDLRSVSLVVAIAVVEAAIVEGLTNLKFDDVERQVREAMWEPRYHRIVAV